MPVETMADGAVADAGCREMQEPNTCALLLEAQYS
jgi:hypothetical protein